MVFSKGPIMGLCRREPSAEAVRIKTFLRTMQK